MYKYMFIESKLLGTYSFKENTIIHRDTIEKYSKDGWRFITAIPKSTGSYGQLLSIDLVFEKQIIEEDYYEEKKVN